MRKILPLILILLIVSGCGGKSDDAGPPSEVESKETVEVARVVKGFLNTNRPVSGILKAVEDALVSAQVSGDVKSINIEEGMTVRGGDLVVTLDDTILRNQVALAEAGYNQASAAYDIAVDPYRMEDLKQAKAALEAAQTAYDVAKSNHDRNVELFDQGVISQQQLDGSRQAFEAAHAQLVNARETVNKMEEGLRPEEIEQAAAALDSAKANLALARENHSNAFMKSPFEGVIAEIFVEKGELVGPGTPVFRVVDPDELHIETSLSDFELAGLEAGQEVDVTVDAVPGQNYPGELSYIAGAADTVSNVFEIHVKIKNPGDELKPGMIAHSNLSRNSENATPLVPVEAVQTKGGERFLFVVEDDGSGETGVAIERPVRIMNFSSEFAEIVEGVSEGELVVVKGIRGLHDGVEVNYYILE